MSSLSDKHVSHICSFSPNVRADHCYNTLVQNHAIQNHSDTSPLLLDAVVTRLLEPSCTCSSESTLHAIHCREQVRSAREERNRALCLARKYRDLAEASQLEKRTLKMILKGKLKQYVTSGGTRLLKEVLGHDKSYEML